MLRQRFRSGEEWEAIGRGVLMLLDEEDREAFVSFAETQRARYCNDDTRAALIVEFLALRGKAVIDVPGLIVRH